MTFTFSNNQEVDYLSLGMCDVCGVRLTRGCEHSNTQNAQEWLAAHIVAEQSKYSDMHPADVAQEITPDPRNADQIELDRWQDEASRMIISGGEVLELSSAQPADNDNIPF